MGLPDASLSFLPDAGLPVWVLSSSVTLVALRVMRPCKSALLASCTRTRPRVSLTVFLGLRRSTMKGGARRAWLPQAVDEALPQVPKLTGHLPELGYQSSL